MIYDPSTSVVFWKTKEQWGEFSNMCAGFPIVVGGSNWLTSEALYQALRFPNNPEVQEAIRQSKSPMGAKMVAKKNKSLTRPDWDTGAREQAMLFALGQKLHQNFHTLWRVFEESGSLPIVEKSHKVNDFWSAHLNPKTGYLEGTNTLGQMLTSIREAVRGTSPPSVVVAKPPEGSKILGHKI